jgi:alkylation response protein AidB-like acyl-CoA dehydrogenase
VNRTLFGADHDDFRLSVAEFINRHIKPHHEDFIQNRGISRETWLAAGSQGLLGLEVPELYGGGGSTDYRFSAVLCEELAKVAAALSSSFGIHCDVVLPYLLELCTNEQKARWLPDFSTGKIVTAIAMTEPTGGSDLAALRTTAVRDGASWVINGAKTFITNGASADLFIVAARTTPETRSRGISLFAVRSTSPGFERGTPLHKLGQPEADTAELFFSDVRVPADNLIGTLNGGFLHMMDRLPRERLSAAVSNVAHAGQILSETLNYSKDRTAFDQPIGSFQYNKFLLAELHTKLDVTQAFVDHCIGAFTRGELSGVDAAKAKWWSAEVQNEILDACVQLFGGYGYMLENRAGRAWADGRVTKIWAGSNQIMKEIIGRDLGL